MNDATEVERFTNRSSRRFEDSQHIIGYTTARDLPTSLRVHLREDSQTHQLSIARGTDTDIGNLTDISLQELLDNLQQNSVEEFDKCIQTLRDLLPRQTPTARKKIVSMLISVDGISRLLTAFARSTDYPHVQIHIIEVFINISSSFLLTFFINHLII